MNYSENRRFWRGMALPLLAFLPVCISWAQGTVHATATIEHTWKKGEYFTSGVEAGTYNEQVGKQTAVIQLEPAKDPTFPGQMVASGTVEDAATRKILSWCFDSTRDGLRIVGSVLNTVTDSASDSFSGLIAGVVGPGALVPPRMGVFIGFPTIQGQESYTGLTGCGPPPHPGSAPITVPGVGVPSFYAYPVDSSNRVFKGTTTVTESHPETRDTSYIVDEDTVTAQITIYVDGLCSASEDVSIVVEEDPGTSAGSSGEMWWFNGEKPTNYNTTLRAAAVPPSTCPHQWYFETGGDKAQIVGPATGWRIQIASKAPSVAPGDVRLRVMRNGVLYPITLRVTVRAPSQLREGRIKNNPDSTWGYLTRISYVVLDQFYHPLTKDLPVSENWLTGPIADYQGTNWRQGPPNGVVAPNAKFLDKIGGELSNKIPKPVWAPYPGANIPVQHWGQQFRAGSVTPGSGRPVQTHTLQKYTDRAAHEAIIR